MKLIVRSLAEQNGVTEQLKAEFQFLPLSDFLHLKSANIKTVSSIFSFINSDLLYNFRKMEWVRQMNACKAQAEEIVKAELIYD